MNMNNFVRIDFVDSLLHYDIPMYIIKLLSFKYQANITFFIFILVVKETVLSLTSSFCFMYRCKL